MAQSEAGKSVRTVPNEEEEEEFGPQLITKLEVGNILYFVSIFMCNAQHFHNDLSVV